MSKVSIARESRRTMMIDVAQSPELLREYTFRWYEEVWNERRTGAIELFMVEESTLNRTKLRWPFRKSEFKRFHTQMLAAFPDLWFCVEEVIVDGDWTAARFITSGTHMGDLDGLRASGKKFRVSGMVMIRWEDGRAVESLYNYDQFGLLKQIGVVN